MNIIKNIFMMVLSLTVLQGLAFAKPSSAINFANDEFAAKLNTTLEQAKQKELSSDEAESAENGEEKDPNYVKFSELSLDK